MPEQAVHVCAYRVLRYTPNLVRDEWVNIGVLIHDPATGRGRARLIEDLAEFARVRKLHPAADQALLRALRDDLQAQLDEHGRELAAYIEKLDQTLSNALQFSAQKGVLTGDLDAELDRLYHDHVALPPLRRTAGEAANTRAGIRARASHVFRAAGLLGKMQKGVPVAEFTYPGDRLRLDYGYRSNGTRGFLHALLLAGDPAQAKALAFTVQAIREKVAKSEFAALTEAAPQKENPGHQFVARLLAGQGIELVPPGALEKFAHRLRPTIH